MALGYNQQFDVWENPPAAEVPAPAVLPWSVTQRSAAATLQTLTRALESGKTHYVQGFSVIVSGANTTVAMTVKLLLNGVVVYEDEFGPSAARGERVGIMLPHALVAPVGTAVAVEVGRAALASSPSPT